MVPWSIGWCASASSRLDVSDRQVCPRQESNLRTRLRRPALYPLSYWGARRLYCATSAPDPVL